MPDREDRVARGDARQPARRPARRRPRRAAAARRPRRSRPPARAAPHVRSLRAAAPGRARRVPGRRAPRAPVRRTRRAPRACSTAPRRDRSRSPTARAPLRACTPSFRKSRTVLWSSSWSSLNAKRIRSSSAGRGCARRSRCAGSRWCRRRSGPRARTGSRRASRRRRCAAGASGSSSAAVAEDAQRGLVHAHVELGPEDLVEARLDADLAAAEQPRHGAVGVERVGLGVHPAAHDLLARAAPARVASFSR